MTMRSWRGPPTPRAVPILLREPVARCRTRPLKTWLTVLAIMAFAGCAGGWEYLPPARISYIPLDPDEANDLIRYRTLRMADFQADEPAPEHRYKKDKIGAELAITVYAARAIVDAVEVPSNPDSTRWEAGVDELRWETLMIPQASWWNPKKRKGDVVQRILEHEQGHFALAELQARRENAHMEESIQGVRAWGPSYADAMREAIGHLRKEGSRVAMGVEAWQAKYDLETKNGTDKKAQKEWNERLARMLAQSE